MAITLYTNPGIGDAYWALMKVLPYEDVHLKVVKANPFRSHFLNYLDGVLSVEEFDMNFPTFCKKAAPFYDGYAATGIAPEMYLDLNTPLETGKRIEQYLPNLQTAFRLGWKLTRQGYKKASQFLEPGKKNILLYTSSLKNNARTGCQGWTYAGWEKVIRNIYENISHANVIWLGANYDATILDSLKHFDKMKIAMAEDADTVLQLILNCSCFVSYQSGLSVLSTVNSVPTYMMYFSRLGNLKNSWCPPHSVGNPNLYKPVFFSDVHNNYTDVTNWVSTVTKAIG
jgi:hypothetical protein